MFQQGFPQLLCTQVTVLVQGIDLLYLPLVYLLLRLELLAILAVLELGLLYLLLEFLLLQLEPLAIQVVLRLGHPCLPLGFLLLLDALVQLVGLELGQVAPLSSFRLQ